MWLDEYILYGFVCFYFAGMASSPSTCILHIGCPSNEEIKPFDCKLWDKVLSVKQTRLSRLNVNSKYSVLCADLPNEYNNDMGYHKSCCKNFTAIPKLDPIPETTEHTVKKVLRSQVSHHEATSSGVFTSTCIFCGNSRRTMNRKIENIGRCKTREAEHSVKEAATILQDTDLLAKIGEVDFIAKEVKYHHTCRKQYLNRAQRSTKPVTEYGKSREIHASAFVTLADYVKENIVGKGRAERMTSIYTRYKTIIGELDTESTVKTEYTVQKLSDRLKTYFGSKILLTKASNKEGTVLYNSHMHKEQAIISAKQYASSFELKVTEGAQHIRASIMHMRSRYKNLPSPLTAEAVIEDQVKLPDVLLQFFRVLFTGSETFGGNSSRAERYVQSAAADAVFMTTRGFVKPSKHVAMGLGLKSMTGSRKVIEMMNHFGHSIGYHIAEALETELATAVYEKNQATPNGLLKSPGLATGLAWDNYDENCETLSGSGRAQCFKDPTRFEKPIPRRKVKNFSADAVKVKITERTIKSKNWKVHMISLGDCFT